MVTLHFKNELSELDRLATETRAFSEHHHLDRTFSYAILLALDELLTNVIMYSMPGRPDASAEIRLDFRESEFTAEIRDNGPAFDPRQTPVPDPDAPIDGRNPGGLGIFLVRSKMDEMNYRREDGWNIVTLRKKL